MFVIFRLLLNNHFGKLAPFGLDRRRNFVRRFKGLLSRLIPLDLKQFRLPDLHPISKAITKSVINAGLAEGRLLWWLANVATKKLPELERQNDLAEIGRGMARLGFPESASLDDQIRPTGEELKQNTLGLGD
jgi:hypothetical protein